MFRGLSDPAGLNPLNFRLKFQLACSLFLLSCSLIPFLSTFQSLKQCPFVCRRTACFGSALLTFLINKPGGGLYSIKSCNDIPEVVFSPCPALLVEWQLPGLLWTDAFWDRCTMASHCARHPPVSKVMFREQTIPPLSFFFISLGRVIQDFEAH